MEWGVGGVEWRGWSEGWDVQSGEWGVEGVKWGVDREEDGHFNSSSKQQTQNIKDKMVTLEYKCILATTLNTSIYIQVDVGIICKWCVFLWQCLVYSTYVLGPPS